MAGIAVRCFTTIRSVHLTTPTNLFGLFVEYSEYSCTLRKAQVKAGLNVRLVLRQKRYVHSQYLDQKILPKLS